MQGAYCGFQRLLKEFLRSSGEVVCSWIPEASAAAFAQQHGVGMHGSLGHNSSGLGFRV